MGRKEKDFTPTYTAPSSPFGRREILTAQELADFLQISIQSVRRLPENELPPYFLIKKSKRWYRSEVERWVQDKTEHIAKIQQTSKHFANVCNSANVIQQATNKTKTQKRGKK